MQSSTPSRNKGIDEGTGSAVIALHEAGVVAASVEIAIRSEDQSRNRGIERRVTGVEDIDKRAGCAIEAQYVLAAVKHARAYVAVRSERKTDEAAEGAI